MLSQSKKNTICEQWYFALSLPYIKNTDENCILTKQGWKKISFLVLKKVALKNIFI